ncbi:MAG: hypothetical protein ACPLKP_00005, partial [Microgenomates group bacterium]
MKIFNQKDSSFLRFFLFESVVFSFFLVINLLLILFLIQHPSSKPLSLPKTFYAQESPSNLEFFGYFHVLCDDIPKLASLNNSNVIKITRGSSSWQDCLQLTKNHNLKAILDVKTIFFQTITDGHYGDGSTVLRSDWETRWQNFKNQIAGFEEQIYAFYMDEPYWKGIKEDDFRLVTNKIRQDYPQIGVFIIEAYPSFMDYWCRLPGPKVNRSYYEYVTDFAFSFYGINYICNQKDKAFIDWNKEIYQVAFQTFLSLTWPNQKLWIIPHAFWPVGYSPDFSLLNSQFKDYFNFAKTNPKIKGMLNFLYSPTENHLSTRQFFDPQNYLYNETYRKTHIEIGQHIVLGIPLLEPSYLTLEFTNGTVEREVQTYYQNSWYFGGNQY